MAAPAWAAEPGLLDAAQGGDHAAAMKALAAHRAEVNTPAEDGTTAVMWAVHNDDLELTRALIAAGADVKAANTYGDTAMREAATNGDVAVIRALLDAGADADSPSPEGQTSLMIVARTANVAAAGLLLDHGAKVNAVESYDQQSALMWAANARQGEMVRLLIARGADVNAVSRVHVIDIHTSPEPRVKYEPSGGMTPLMFAAREGCVDCVKALIGAGAKLDAYDPDNVTSLVYALWNAHFDAAKVLIEAGADVNRWDLWGRTPLWAAVDYNTIPHGGRPDRPSTDETTPLEVIKLLIAKGANVNAQLKAAPPFRDNGADRGADMMMNTGASILLRAAKAGDTEVVKLLLDAGARTDLAVAREWRDPIGGITALMAASGLSNQPQDTRGKLKTEEQVLATVKLLIAAGADVNARDERGGTALHGAVYRGWNSVVRALIEAGADPYQADASGKSAYDIAVTRPVVLRLQVLDIKPDTAALITQLKPRTVAAADTTTKAKR
jgi:ankyrin repeat protein